MTIGRLDLTLNYPERQASYPVSVRRAQCLSSASFRFLLTKDTLAFDYKIPVITALLRLEVYILALLRIDTCPAHAMGRTLGARVHCMKARAKGPKPYQPRATPWDYNVSEFR